MKNKHPFLILLVLLTLFSCRQPDPEVEPFLDPQIINIPGHDFFVRGTIGGEAFAFEHISRSEYNFPSSSNIDFSSLFLLEPANPFVRDKVYGLLKFGFTNSSQDSLLEVLKEGSIPWYNFEDDPSTGEAYIESLEWQQSSYSSLYPSNNTQQAAFHISNIEAVEIEGPFRNSIDGQVYKLEGSFNTMLYTTDGLERDSVELVIEEFSALFNDPIR